jgi:hypothetical protein
MKFTTSSSTFCCQKLIEKIEVIEPEKIMDVYILGKKYRMTLQEPDVFDLSRGCYIALAKYMFGKGFTPEGIEYMASMLAMQKYYVSEVNKAVKKYYKKIEAEEKQKKEEEARKAARQRKRDKKRKKKECDGIQKNQDGALIIPALTNEELLKIPETDLQNLAPVLCEIGKNIWVMRLNNDCGVITIYKDQGIFGMIYDCVKYSLFDSRQLKAKNLFDAVLESFSITTQTLKGKL